jgi:antitoxin (DNA-binding transcriptional repressor) of toxin-antitoxin stability system
MVKVARTIELGACLAVLERVRKTGQPIRVTRFGQAVAEINPPGGAKRTIRMGGGIGTMEILGDIVGPIGDESDWEAAREPESDPEKKLK